MSGVLTETKNIWLSTQQSGDLSSDSSTFNRFKMCLNHNVLRCGQDQFQRISLSQFNCHRTWYNINKYNNLFILHCKKAGVQQSPVEIKLTEKDYVSIGAVAEELSEKIKDALDTISTLSFTIDTATRNPPATFSLGQTGTRTFFSKFTATSHTLTDVVLQTPQYYKEGSDIHFNDSYILAGGSRVTSESITEASFKATVTANDISIQGRFPMVLNTMPYIYIKCALAGDNLESQNLSNFNAGIDTHITGSQIIAKVPVQNEYCSYSGDDSTPFYMNVTNKAISEILFSVCDHHGRTLAVPVDATGEGKSIETDGSLHSDLCVRVEVYQMGRNPNFLELKPQKSTYTRNQNNLYLDTTGKPESRT